MASRVGSREFSLRIFNEALYSVNYVTYARASVRRKSLLCVACLIGLAQPAVAQRHRHCLYY